MMYTMIIVSGTASKDWFFECLGLACLLPAVLFLLRR